MGGNKIIGGIIFVIGAIAFGFGANEAVSSITGYNAIKEWIGEDLYNGLYMGFTVAATIASIVGGVYLKSLAKNAVVKVGDGEHSVYIAREQTGQNAGEIYVGRTKQSVQVRLDQHAYKGAPKALITKLDGLNYQQVRGLEQGLIDALGGVDNLSNAINGIASSNPNYNQYMEAGKKFIDYFKDIIGVLS